jgi:hypothetical protein
MKSVAFACAVLVSAAPALAADPKWVPLDSHQAKVMQGQAVPSAQPAAPSASVSPSPNTAPAPATAGPPPTAPSNIQASAIATLHKGLTLWRNIEDGMPIMQVHALYPQGANVDWHADRTVLTHVPIIEGCEAKVNVMHPNGVVTEIVMRGEGAIAGRCSLKIITALSGKYGEPLDKDKVHGSLFGREGKNYIWTRDGVTLQFKRYTSGALGGGGLFSASWELRYSTAASNIDL